MLKCSMATTLVFIYKFAQCKSAIAISRCHSSWMLTLAAAWRSTSLSFAVIYLPSARCSNTISAAGTDEPRTRGQICTLKHQREKVG